MSFEYNLNYVQQVKFVLFYCNIGNLLIYLVDIQFICWLFR